MSYNKNREGNTGSSLPTIQIGKHQVKATVVSEDLQLNTSLTNFLSKIGQGYMVKNVVGMCIESALDSNQDAAVENKVVLLQLCHGTSCLIIQLLSFPKIPVCLINFLALPGITFVGVGIKEDVARLRRDYGLDCRNAVELGPLAASVEEKHVLAAYGLVDLYKALEYKEYRIPPEVILCSWSSMELNKVQIEKAASDAFVSFILGNRLLGGYLGET